MTGAVTVRFLRKSTRNSLNAFILIASLHSKHFFSNESSEVHWSPPSKLVNLPWNYYLTYLVLNCRPRRWENISIIVRALLHRRLGESRSRSAPGEIEKLCAGGGVGGGGGGGGWERYTLFKPYHVPPQRVWFLGLFWSENGYRLCPFWSGIGQYGFRGNYGSVWTYLSFQFEMNKI